MHELRDSAELTLSDAIAQIAPCDVLLVEGFKSAPIPKLEVWRADNGKALLHPGDPNIVAIATDRPGQIQATVPVYALDDVDAIATLVQDRATGGTPRR
jgi:molybdopterin-guanine dinucleotide biosynthesis protein B